MNVFKKRNSIFVALAGLFTFGIYYYYWLIVTKREMRMLGAQIPTAWIMIIPFANIVTIPYYLYKYAQGFSAYVKKDDSSVLWFIILLFTSFIGAAIVQNDLNKFSDGQGSQQYFDPNRINAIISYLNQNKAQYPMNALTDALQKSGYTQAEISQALSPSAPLFRTYKILLRITKRLRRFLSLWDHILQDHSLQVLLQVYRWGTAILI